MSNIINADNGVVSGIAGVKLSSDSTGVLDIQTNGTTAITISTAQVVSLTNSPTFTGGTANGVLYLNASKVATSGSALVFDGTNLLGVGTNGTPSHGVKGIVTANSGNASALQLTNNTGSGSVGGSIIYAASGDDFAVYTFTGAIGSETYALRYNIASGGASHRWNVGASEAMRLTSTGLGIGTTTPAGKLDVVTTATPAAVFRNTTAASYTSLRLYNDQNSGSRALEIDYMGSTYSGGERAEIFVTGAYPLLFGTNNTERARIDSSGRLLLNTTGILNSGNSTFSVLAQSTSSLAINAAAPNSFTSVVINAQSVTTAGTGWYSFAGQSGDGSSITTNNILIYGNGNVANVNNSYGAISDIKLKENIVDATPKLNKLMQVRIRNYNLKGEYQQHKQIGVVAQELEQVFPAMIEEAPDRDAKGNDLGTTTKSVKYSVFVPMLVKAIQEQQAIITQLTARITALEGT